MEFVILWMVIMAWIGCGVLAAAGVNAFFRAEFPSRNNARERRMDRNQFLAMGIFLGPLFLIGSVIFTGGFSDGFTLSGEPLTQEEIKEIRKENYRGF